MDTIHFEKQEASLCAQHALNMLLQGSYFTAVDLAEIASDVDNREGSVIRQMDAKSHNVDDSGYFSVQVIAQALRVFNLELISLKSPQASVYQADPTLGQAYICNLNEHWFAVRRFGFQWFTLNSLLSSPKLISDTYLSILFAQLTNDGYSIFVIEGNLPRCVADEQLRQCPVDPSLAAQSDSHREDQSDDPSIARAKALSIQEQGQEDEDLKLALKLSRQEMDAMDQSLQNTLEGSFVELQNGNDTEETDEEQLRRAVQMSIECFQTNITKRNPVSSIKASEIVQSATDSSASDVANSMAETSGNREVESTRDSDNTVNTSENIRTKRENFLMRFKSDH